MNRMIFVNLPVADLATSRRFYADLGFGVDERFSDAQCACVVVSDTIYVMLLSRDRFADFVTGSVADPAAGTSVINCLSASSHTEVDLLVGRALACGGKPWLDILAEGPMYGGSFADPDGHVWEILSMDQDAIG